MIFIMKGFFSDSRLVQASARRSMHGEHGRHSIPRRYLQIIKTGARVGGNTWTCVGSLSQECRQA